MDELIEGYYNLTGQRVLKDTNGFIIVRYNDGTTVKILNK